MQEAWEHTLRGGLESIEGKVMNITDYFICHGIEPNESFIWEGIEFTPIQTIHIVNGYKFMHSYGLLIKEDLRTAIPKSASDPYPTILITTDTQYAPYQLNQFYDKASIVFHDCETAPYYSRVHAHYDDLKKLDPTHKSKMWLCHYQDNPPQDPIKDGFAGFVKKGQEFEI